MIDTSDRNRYNTADLAAGREAGLITIRRKIGAGVRGRNFLSREAKSQSTTRAHNYFNER